VAELALEIEALEPLGLVLSVQAYEYGAVPLLALADRACAPVLAVWTSDPAEAFTPWDEVPPAATPGTVTAGWASVPEGLESAMAYHPTLI